IWGSGIDPQPRNARISFDTPPAPYPVTLATIVVSGPAQEAVRAAYAAALTATTATTYARGVPATLRGASGATALGSPLGHAPSRQRSPPRRRAAASCRDLRAGACGNASR